MKVDIVNSKDLERKTWDDFILQSPQGCIYALSWYMDIVCGDWLAIIVSTENTWEAVMPIQIKKKLVFSYSLQPILSRYLGIFFTKKDFETNYREYQWKHDTVELIISKIPKEIKHFEYNFSPLFDYPLPFYWKGYSLTHRYNYYLDLDVPIGAMEKNFGSQVFRYIKKNLNQGIILQRSDTPAPLIQILDKNISSGKKILEKKYFKRLETIFYECQKRNCSDLYIAKDKEDIISCIYLLYFKNTAYNFIGLVSPEYKKTGVMNLMFWDAFQRSKLRAKRFSFEGSMLEGVESFIRNFNSKPVPYLVISKRKYL